MLDATRTAAFIGSDEGTRSISTQILWMSMSGADIVGLIYDAAGGDIPWSDVATVCAHVFEAPSVVLGISNLQDGTYPTLALHGLGDGDWRDYNEHWIGQDPHLALLQKARPGTVVATQDVTPPGSFRSSPYYGDFLSDVGLFWSAYALAEASPRTLAALCCHREEGQAPFEADQCREIAGLAQHLRRALAIEQRLEGHAAADKARQVVLDLLPIGVLVIDSQGRIIGMNRAAAEMTSAGDGLCVRGSRLVPFRTDDATNLERALSQTIRKRAIERTALRIGRPSGARAWTVVVAAIVGGSAAQLAKGGAALVFLQDPERSLSIRTTHLRSLYNLTPAEARVAAAVCEGGGLVEAAESLRISHETARHHLRQILAKTGCRRQSELVSLLLATPGVWIGL